MCSVAILSRKSPAGTSRNSPEKVPATFSDSTTESPSATANVSSAVRRFMSRAASVYLGSFHGIGAPSARNAASAANDNAASAQTADFR